MRDIQNEISLFDCFRKADNVFKKLFNPKIINIL